MTGLLRKTSLPAIVAVPAKDEADRIGACLRALALQADTMADAIVLVVNNTTDATADVVRALLPSLPVPVHLIEHDFPPERASAGSARRMAMERAASMFSEAGRGEAGVVLTTDADGRVPPDWVAANLRHIRGGADVVAGRVVLDAIDAVLIPPKLHADDALECAYAAALDEIAALMDPDPCDPWPRHTEHAGASIAVTVDAYWRAGGMPAAPLAEDRRFFAKLRQIDARIRHATDIEVVVSGRLVGRAEGGMADTIRRRLSAPDPYLDDSLEPLGDHARRLALRADFRRAWRAAGVDSSDELAASFGLPSSAIRAAVGAAHFGQGWAYLESASPALSRTLLPAKAVSEQLAQALAMLSARRALVSGRLTDGGSRVCSTMADPQRQKVELGRRRVPMQPCANREPHRPYPAPDAS